MLYSISHVCLFAFVKSDFQDKGRKSWVGGARAAPLFQIRGRKHWVKALLRRAIFKIKEEKAG